MVQHESGTGEQLTWDQLHGLTMALTRVRDRLSVELA